MRIFITILVFNFLFLPARSQSTPQNRFYNDIKKASNIHDTIAAVLALKISTRNDQSLRESPIRNVLQDTYPRWTAMEISDSRDSLKIIKDMINNEHIRSYISSQLHLEGIRNKTEDKIEEKLRDVERDGSSHYLLSSYYKILQYNYLGKRDSALTIALEMDSLLNENFFPEVQLYLYSDCLHRYTTFNDILLGLCKKSLRISKTINEYVERYSIYNCLLVHYKNVGDINTSMEYGMRCIEIAEKSKNYKKQIEAYCNLASFHQEQGNFDKAYELIDHADSLVKVHDLPSEKVFPMGARAFALMNEKKYPQAIEILKNLLKLDIEGHNTKALFYINVLDAFHATQEYDSVYVYFQKYLEFEPRNISGYRDYAKSFVVPYHINKGNYKIASQYIDAAYADAEAYGDISTKSIVLKEKARLMEAQGNYKLANQYYKEHFDLEMDFRSEEKATEVATTQLNAEFEKERAITALKTEQEKALFKSQRNQAYILGGSGILLALLAFGFLNAIRKKNKEIASKNEELSQLNNTKDTLFQIIGHDLKKPTIGFRNIGNNINYLIDKQDYKRLRDLGQEVDQDAKSLYNLTDNLLNWALLQKDAINIQFEDVNVANLVGENIELFHSIAGRKSITIRNNVDDRFLAKVDRNSLDTIIRNVMDNAIKYTNSGGLIEISAKEIDGMIQLFVEDSGKGFDIEVIKMMEEGKSVKSEKGTADEKGSGLGLELIRYLLNKNRGSLRIQNSSEKGAIVQISLQKAS